jgi:hypothetical protein
LLLLAFYIIIIVLILVIILIIYANTIINIKVNIIYIIDKDN